MTLIYSACAVIGGTVLICQLVMTVMGLGGDSASADFADAGDIFDHSGGHSADHGHDGAAGHSSNWFFGIITFQTVVAAITFFGLGGMASMTGGLSSGMSVATAVALGLAAMLGVHSMMKALQSLRADGTIRVAQAIGRPGTVYLRVPAAKAGVGKVQVNVQNRTVEYEAMTAESELPVGTRVVVVGVVGSDTVEVQAANEQGNTGHA